MAENKKNTEVYFKPAAQIVLIDDSELNRDFIKMAFKKPNYEIATAAEGLGGIELVQRTMPELILLDIMMPGLDGYDVAAILKADPKTANIPIIFITALNDIQDKLKAFEAGAVDFVTKPFNHRELIARVRTNVENRRLIRQKDEMMQIAMEDKRNTAIARIAGGISHNINNMLSTAFGNVMLLEGLLQDKLDSTTSEAFNDIKKSLENIQLLAKRFLVISGHQQPVWRQEVKPVDFKLTKIIADFIENLNDLPTKLKVEYNNLVPPETTIHFDPTLVLEFLQLLGQEAYDTAQDYVKFNFNVMPGHSMPQLVMSIQTDRELPEGLAESIFEPFALQANNVGSGLAFAVARNLIEHNGGQVIAEIPEGNHSIVMKVDFAPFDGDPDNTAIDMPAQKP